MELCITLVSNKTQLNNKTMTTRQGLSATEISKESQAQDKRTRPVVLAALVKHLTEKGKTFTIVENEEPYGAYDWTLEVDGKLWYCELKTRNLKYKSTTFTGDFYTTDKRKKINLVNDNQLFFTCYPSDKTILVYDVNKTIAERKCDMTMIKTEQNTVNKGFNMVDKSFYNLHKKAAFLKLKF